MTAHQRALVPTGQSKSPSISRSASPTSLLGMGRGIATSLVAPVLVFATFFFVPLIILVVTSFSRWSGVEFALTGVENYQRMSNDPTFWRAVGNTLLYASVGVLVQVPLGILIGIALAQRIPGWHVFRAILFLPYLVSGAALALVFGAFYNPRYGLLNTLLGAAGLPAAHDWLFAPNTAIWAVAACYAFIVGFAVVLTMAEIASIPQELYEAAEVDGASRLQKHIRITLPLIRNVIGTLVLLSLIANLALFDLVYILTSGGPNDATVTLVLYAFRAYTSGNWGYANAVGVVIVLLGLLLVLTTRRAFRIGDER